MDESKLQILPPDQREFPFAPQNENADDFDASIAVDMSPYCCAQLQDENDTSVSEQTVARSLLTQLRETGFCYVRGTGISSELCQDALSVTNAFLQNANEDVRRSTMTKDRARRGYSPMCTENFSSLVGQHGPNDLVRKFRMGPPSVDTRTGNGANNSLLQPNVWPDEKCWDADSTSAFRRTLEMYYEAASRATQSVVLAICDGLLLENPELQPALEPFMRQKRTDSSSTDVCATTTTSILTCLGYRVGTRHKGNDKGPMVAPHTDVGVITMLLFDNGNCASLQRSDGKHGWVDVHLPSHVPRDPIFVVNVADCLSEMSQGSLPSTLHQVVAKPAGKVPRNCCAFFVGLEPDARLLSNGTEMSYEEWRKLRIFRAQNLLSGSRM
jgi:isopenicillin N synthase-like dioxygenase